MVGFILFVLIMAGPKYFKSVSEGGTVEVTYTPPNTSYIHQHVVPQPTNFNPIKLGPQYFIGITQTDINNSKHFSILVVEEEGRKYVIRQTLHTFNGEYKIVKEMADLYAKNYGLSTRRIF